MLSFTKIKDAIVEMISQTRGLNEQIAAKRKQVEDLQKLPLPREDYIAAICESIDSHAAGWREQLQLATKSSRESYAHPIPLNLLSSNGAYSEYGKVFPTPIYAIFGPAIKEAIRSEIEKWPWPAVVGPPRSERPAAIAKLTKEIAEIEAQQRELTQQAKEAGINIADAPGRDGKRADVNPSTVAALDRTRQRA